MRDCRPSVFDLVTFISLLFIFQTGAAAIRARARFNNRHTTCHQSSVFLSHQIPRHYE